MIAKRTRRHRQSRVRWPVQIRHFETLLQAQANSFKAFLDFPDAPPEAKKQHLAEFNAAAKEMKNKLAAAYLPYQSTTYQILVEINNSRSNELSEILKAKPKPD